MRWAFLCVTIGGFASLWGVAPGIVLFIAFGVMFGNFATFCVLYDRPKDRARQRMTDQMRQANPSSDATQRMATATITTTAVDRQLGYGPMTIVNLATGIGGLGLLVWGVVLRTW